MIKQWGKSEYLYYHDVRTCTFPLSCNVMVASSSGISFDGGRFYITSSFTQTALTGYCVNKIIPTGTNSYFHWIIIAR